MIDEARFPGRQGRLVFAYLAAEQGRPVPRDELAEALWGEAPPPTWDKALTVIVSKLRGLLAEHGGGANALTGGGCGRGTRARHGPPRESRGRTARHGGTRRAAKSRRRRLVVVLVGGVVVAAVAATAAVVLLARGAPSSAAAEVSADSVGVFDAKTGRLIAQAAVRTSPSAIAVGENAIWSANLDDDSVSKIDPTTNAAVDTVPVGKGSDGIAVGGGFVWVSNGVDGTVSKIDPRIDRVVDEITVGNGPSGIAFGEGAVWVANATDRTVTRIDPNTGDQRVMPAGAGADGIAVGDGAVWVTSESAGTLTRIDPRVGIVAAPINVGNGASAVAVGRGAVWVANTLDSTVTRVDPASNAVRSTIRVGAGPSALAVTDGGKTVVVTSKLGGTVWRIQADRAEPMLTTGNRPEAVAINGGTMYVAVQTSGLTHRGGVLRVLASNRFDSIDPAVAYTSNSWKAVILTNDGLVTFKREGGSEGTRVVPDLATDIPTPTNGGRTYTFQIRRGIHYSNGAPVQPADFRRGIERSVLTNARSGAGQWLLLLEHRRLRRVREAHAEVRPLAGDRYGPGGEHCDLPPGRPRRRFSQSARTPVRRRGPGGHSTRRLGCRCRQPAPTCS